MGERAPLQSAIAIADAVRAGERLAHDATRAALDAIAQHNPALNAFVHVDEDAALRQAARIDQMVAAGQDPGPLAGVPIGAKDLRDHCVGMPTRMGSLFHADDAPQKQDSPHIARLKAAGAIIVGKTATAEFGMDGVTATRAHGVTRNPWRLSQTPGGSSGGAAACVAAGLTPIATASDGAGSTRCPAGYVGAVGLKPSMGRIPRNEGFSDRSCVGVVSTNVRDWARYLDVVQGPHPNDRMGLPKAEICYERAVETLDVGGLRAAWSPDLGYAPVEPEIAAIAETTARALVDAARLQLTATPVQLTNTYIDTNLMLTESFVRELEAKHILPDRIGELSRGPRFFVDLFYKQFTPRGALEAAEKERRLALEIASLFTDIDVLLTPTNSCAAYAAEGPLPEIIAGQDASATHAEPFTMLANICWNPSISVPAGVTKDGMPVGLLITVQRHRDDIALRLARLLEQAKPWPLWAPGFAGAW